MRILRFFFLLLLLFPAPLFAQNDRISTMGTDFWVGFLENIPDYERSFSLLVSGPDSTWGTVSATNGFTASFVVTPGQVTIVNIPDYFETTDLGLHVTTRHPVSLYASNFEDYSYDVTGVLPTPSLGSDYLLQSYLDEWRGAEFCVVATRDSTIVHYQQPGSQVTTARLDAGRRLLLSSRFDISGTRVWTDDCTPVAVFTGCHCTNIPAGYGACDHIYEQSVPTRYWGRRFVVTSSLQRTYDIMKVTALFDSTIVSYGRETSLLHAGESFEYRIVGASMPSLYVESNRSISVFLYLTGASYGGLMGDPSCCTIHPIEQQLSQATFATYNTATSRQHYVNVAVDSGTVGLISLDGVPIADTAFHPVLLHPEYAYARLPLLHGSHILSAPTTGFNAQVYGLGQAESYAYAVGASLELINPQVWLNNIPVAELDNGNSTFCPGDTLLLSARVVDESRTIVYWDFGNGSTAEGRVASVVFDSSGSYNIMARFLLPDSCLGLWQDSVTFTVYIDGGHELFFDTVVCGDSCLWLGQVYYDTGSFSQPLPGSLEHCPTIGNLHILALLHPASPSIIPSYDCHNALVRLAARGSGDYCRWSATPSDDALLGHEHDTVFSTSFAGDRRYQLYMAYLIDTSCGTSVDYHKPAITPFVAYADASPRIVSNSNNTVRLTDLSPNSVGRSWYIDGSFCSDQRQASVAYPLSLDSATLLLDAYDVYACHDTDTIVLHLRRDALYVPNAFIPSSDPNSHFNVKGVNIRDYEIWIYDRHGALVFHSTDIHQPWDGTYQGVPLSQGTYTYTILYTTIFLPDRRIRLAGTVTLIR